MDKYRRGDVLNSLSAQAYAGRIDRRTFLNLLLKAGVAAGAASAWAHDAALASENQARQRIRLETSYDYIVIGAGSAGCVLANRLSKDPAASVLLIEAGSDDLDLPQLTEPSLWPTNIGSQFDWALPTTAQEELFDRSLLLAAGRVVGGSGSINGMLWLRGDERDYDAWAEAGGSQWGFDSLIKAFKKVESFPGGGRLRGDSGPIPVRTPASEHALTPLFLRAAREELGVRHVSLNGGRRLDGTDVAEVNVDDGRRVGPAQGYLEPVLSRPNLTLLPSTMVLRLLISGRRCQGVVVLHNGERRVFGAASEVLLCAGALGTPKLLLLSGIGPVESLRNLDIHCHENLPAVGRNLHDHVIALGSLYFPTSRDLPPMIANGFSTVTYFRPQP